MHQAGGYIISEDKKKSGFDSPESKEAFHFIKKLIDKGISPSAKTVMETEGKQLFLSGKVAMIPAISVSAGEFQGVLGDKLGVAPLPKGKQQASIVHGIGWAMFWDTEDLMRHTRLSWNTILKEFFYDKDFPKRKLGRKWLFPTEKTKKFLLDWLEKQNG